MSLMEAFQRIRKLEEQVRQIRSLIGVRSILLVSFLTLSLLRVINVKIPLQPHKKYDITQYGEFDFS